MSCDNYDAEELGWPQKPLPVRKTRVRKKLTNQQKAGRATAKLQKLK